MNTISKILLPATIGGLFIGGVGAQGSVTLPNQQTSCPIISQINGNCNLDSILGQNGSCDLESILNGILGNLGSGNNGGNGNQNSGNNGSSENVPEISLPETDGSLTSTEQSYIAQVVKLVNEERAKNGLSALTYDATLQRAAQVRAEEIVKSFSHTRPNGSNFSSVLKEFGISARRSGENIAWGQKTPKEVVTAWMNSSGHRANILNANYTKIGVGCNISPSGTIYWSQLFTN
ncbi:MAG: CAP domain-containing protein [Lachnospiraceae bacterium]